MIEIKLYNLLSDSEKDSITTLFQQSSKVNLRTLEESTGVPIYIIKEYRQLKYQLPQL